MTMDPVRIKDNSQINKEAFYNIKNLETKILNKPLKNLEKEGVFVFPETIFESEDLEQSQMILQDDNGIYKTHNIMGFIGYGDERLIISSRFSNNHEDYFFQYLLSRLLDTPNVVNLETDLSYDNSIVNYLYFLFPYLLRVAIRKGLFKQYVYNEYNDRNIKGVIDIARHIKYNTPFMGRVAYRQREFSYDNYLLQLIRHTIEFIQNKSFGKAILSKIKNEVQLIVDATYTYKVHDRQSIIDKDFYHPKNKSRSGSEQLFSGNRQQGLIYPDFISRNANNRIIADAKYKPIDNIRSKDYLQVLAYMFRFDAKIGYYLYPESTGKDNEKLRLNQGTKYEQNVSAREDIYVMKCGLEIPCNTSTYLEFVDKIQINEDKFISNFSNI